MKKYLLTALLGLIVSASAMAASAGIPTMPSGSGDVPTVIMPVKPQKSVLRDSIIVTQGDFTYELFTDGTATLTRYNGSDTEIIVPESVSNQGMTFKVTKIAGIAQRVGAFNEGIKKVTLPSSITTIGDYAFSGCSGLTNITIPSSVTSIGIAAFSYCTGFTNISLPNSITSIGDGAFGNCSNLTSITLPNSITSIEGHTFFLCDQLTNITIPSSVTSIGIVAFEGCSGLKSIKLPNSITSIEAGAFEGCSGLTSITLPNSITSIEYGTFRYCSGLTGITLPSSITAIGAYAFEGCSGLTDIILPHSVSSVNIGAFNGCSGLKSFTVEKGNQYLSTIDGVLVNAEKDTLIAYPNAKGSTYEVPQGVKAIGYMAFSRCEGLNSITLANSVTEIGDEAFSGCYRLTSITLPNSLTSINFRAFEGCWSLTSIALPNFLTSIGYQAFEGCTGITDVTLPNSITSIGHFAFENCSGLKNVYFENKEPSDINIGNYVFERTSATLYVPVSAMNSYKELFPNQTVAANPNITVTISDAKYATYFSVKTYTMPTGLTGAIVTEAKAEGKLGLSWDYKAGDTVPAGTALLLTGDEGLYDMSDFTTQTAAVPENNLLRGSIALSSTKTADGSQDALFYKLSYNNEGTKLGFYWGNDNGAAFFNPAHRCYLALPKAQYAHVKGFSLEGDDTVTAITGVNANTSAKVQKIYTLDGRRVNATSTQGLPAGLYIVDGTKTIVK